MAKKEEKCPARLRFRDGEALPFNWNTASSYVWCQGEKGHKSQYHEYTKFLGSPDQKERKVAVQYVEIYWTEGEVTY